MRKVVSVAFAVMAAAALWVTPALADGPGVGTPAVVSIGDSAISGEAGRWAGNTNGSPSNVDALGPTAYYDAGSAEAIHGCHRSKASEIGIGVNGNVLSGQENVCKALGFGMVVIIAVVMVFYSILQRRASRWLR